MLPQITVRWDLLASTAVYVALLLVGAHGFLRWLYREMRKDANAGPGVWKWRWTLGATALILLMFVAGTAMVGVVHQTVWLARSPEPLYRRGSPKRNVVLCASHLRQIGYALAEYAKANGGRYSDDLAVLPAQTDLEVRFLSCPATDDERAAGARPSYIYFGKGLTEPVEATKIVVVEPLENHEGSGLNVLYGGGRVEWLDRPAAEAVLTSLGFDRVEPSPP